MDLLTWTGSSTISADPPSNLAITVLTGERVLVSTRCWRTFKVQTEIATNDKPKVSPYQWIHKSSMTCQCLFSFFSDLKETNVGSLFIVTHESNYTFHDLTSGATYELQVYSVYENKVSQSHLAQNFTTRPNPPGKSTMLFANENTMCW